MDSMCPLTETSGGRPERVEACGRQQLPDAADDPDLQVLLGGGPPVVGLPTEQARVRTYDAVVRLIRRTSAEGVLVVIFEDLHWADEPSLALLGLLAGRGLDAPIILIGTHRAEEVQADAALGVVLSQFARLGRVKHLRLQGLDEADVAAMMGDQLGSEPEPSLVALAAGRTDGNPFFLTELARLALASPEHATAAWNSVPGSIRDVLLRRLSRLPTATASLLSTASVVGRDCDLSLLQAITPVHSDPVDVVLEPAYRAGFVTEELHPRPRIRFVHALVRETLYEQLRPIARARLHAATGAALLDRASDLDDVAHHLLEGSAVADPAAIVPLLLQTANRAYTRLAFEHAARLLDRTVMLIASMPPGPARDAVELAAHTQRGLMLASTLGYAAGAAQESLSIVRSLSRHTPPGPDTMGALFGMSAAYNVASRTDLAQEIAGEFHARRDEPEPVGRRFDVLGRWVTGTIVWREGDDRGTVSLLEPAEALLDDEMREVLSREVLSMRCALSAALVSAGREEEGARLLAAQARTAAAEHDYFAVATTAYFAALHAFLRGRVDDVLQPAAEARTVGSRYGFEFWECTGGVFEGWALTRAGGTRSERLDGLDLLARSVHQYGSSGARMFTPLYLALLADAQRVCAQYPAAEASQARAAELAVELGERDWLPEVKRIATR